MLSIVIPVYNYDVRPLVFELQKQCLECNIIYEILVQDDASFSKYNIGNDQINKLDNCSFVALKQNVAHRENRNLLAKQSKFEYLLFIDGDSNCLKSNYIAEFLFHINNVEIIYGGRIHPAKCPSKNQILRWNYGKLREDKLAKVRAKDPLVNLLFNNTIIKKSVFETVGFNSIFKKYGHDDTQLSYELSKKKYTVLHIDNQIEHGEIDCNTDYLLKTKQAVENLFQFYEKKIIDLNFIKILKLYHLLRILKLNYSIGFVFRISKKRLEKRLLGSNPNMKLFSFYKIGYLCSLKSAH